ncbi:MAG: response regulator transcription factor [Flavobacteriales bacterium]|nr:response regulator transcription factor [Flavobacteriales bacterium]
MNSRQRTILLADDQSIILDGLEALLEQNPAVRVVGRASTGVEAVMRARELKPDIVLMDINMPELDGIEATKALLKCSSRTRVLVLSMHDHKDVVQEVLEAGAKGYLLKNVGKEELMEAILTVAAGKRYLAREIRDRMELPATDTGLKQEKCYTALTKREKQVVQLICMERTTMEIATALNISPETVNSHRKNIMIKLDVRNIAGLVKYAKDRGWC